MIQTQNINLGACRYQQKLLAELNGYIQSPQILERIDEYTFPVALDGKAGILGAFILAEWALT